MTDIVEAMFLEVERHLNQISKIFKRGTRLTFIARTPGNDEADVLITIDTEDELIELLKRRKAAAIQAKVEKK